MMSARGYRNDISDIIGVLIYAWKDGRRISATQIEKAVDFLYEDKKTLISEDLLRMVQDLTTKELDELNKIYQDEKKSEDEVRKEILAIDKNYPGTVKEDTVDSIVNTIRSRGRH